MCYFIHVLKYHDHHSLLRCTRQPLPNRDVQSDLLSPDILGCRPQRLFFQVRGVMKLAAFAALTGSAAAFSPAQTGKAATALNAF